MWAFNFLLVVAEYILYNPNSFLKANTTKETNHEESFIGIVCSVDVGCVYRVLSFRKL